MRIRDNDNDLPSPPSPLSQLWERGDLLSIFSPSPKVGRRASGQGGEDGFRGVRLFPFGVLMIITIFSLLLSTNSLIFAQEDKEASADSLHFAIIGDFGVDNTNEADVAELVERWAPEFIVTVGDNVYDQGTTFDAAVGKYYCDYLANITPDADSPACDGGKSAINRFFPAFGNHDYADGPIDGPEDYLNYFDLPGDGISSSNTSGNELYYDVIQEPIHFFFLDSDRIDRKGRAGSEPYHEQRAWLKTQLAASTTPWQIVLFHHPAYSSGSAHGSQSAMQWPFAEWGADAVIAGHEHSYERINLDGIVYFVNGLGGRGPYGFDEPVAGSQVRYHDANGAMLVEANEEQIAFQFINVEGDVIDRYRQTLPPATAPAPPSRLPPVATIDIAISEGADDVEEAATDGSMYLDSSDIELGDDPYHLGAQTVGLRFQDVPVPNQAIIVSAYLEFTAHEASSEETRVEIRAEVSHNAAPFESNDYNLTSRSLTSQAIKWEIAPWDSLAERHQSPDLSPLVQQIVNRQGWNSAQSIVFIINGDGRRITDSYEGNASAAARLQIEYLSSSPTGTLWQRIRRLYKLIMLSK